MAHQTVALVDSTEVVDTLHRLESFQKRGLPCLSHARDSGDEHQEPN